MDKRELLSSIPKVDDILNHKGINDLYHNVPRVIIVESIRETLNEIRELIIKGKDEYLTDYNINMDSIMEAVRYKALKSNHRHLKRVVNASGIIIHTNLGRSILCKEAVDAVIEISKNYSNLEYDLDEGKRGSRYSHVEEIIIRLTGAESAIVVNNNAAAVLLVLSTLCKSREAIVSRGELVEIGGSFRIPEVMEQSGARLVEVGATNRTHFYDYERAINENTGALLKVHTSNYRILGFTEAVSARELVELAGKNNLPLIEDIGSGSFIDLSRFGVEYEPTVKDAVKSGIDIITFSGDKMLGGPQAGIIIGKKKYTDMMKKNPLSRALRVDKMTLAAMEATLKLYIEEEVALKSIPTLKMIVEPLDKLKERAKRLLRMIKPNLKEKADLIIVEDYSQVGGGSMPLEYLSTYVISVKPNTISAARLEEGLRCAEVPIIVRTQKDSILFDIRTINEEEYPIIRDELNKIL